jgi:diamine N-acetyltransferase
MPITEQIAPHEHTTTTRLASGETLTLRPMRPNDASRFGAFLAGLSEETRSYWRPHPFDQETADAVCATLDPTVLRLVATVARGEGEQIVAYATLKIGVREADGKRYRDLGIPLDPTTDVALAPCVADEYQNQGLGGEVIRHVLGVAKALGRKRMILWGGVQARNTRAIHFYEKWGFRKAGEFLTDQNNHDMILELAPPPSASPEGNGGMGE